MLKSSIIVTFLSLLASVVSFLNQVLIAQYFGASRLMDLYISASSLPTFLGGLITAALSYSLTPQLIKYKISSKGQFPAISGNLFLLITKYAAIISFTAMLVSVFSLPYIFPAVTLNIYIAFWVNILGWMTAFFSIPLSFLACYSNANKNFWFPLLLAFLPYIATIVSCVLLYEQYSVLSISIGLLVGTVLAVSISFIHFKNHFSFGVIENSASRSINAFIRKIPVAALAMICFTVYQTIDAYWAPRTGGSNLSYLGYCQRLLIAIGALVITGPSTVLVPRLSEALAENREKDFLNDSVLAVKIIIALSSVVAIIGSVLAKDIIFIMFERGAFTRTDTLAIAALLPYMLTGMVFMLCVVLLFRVLFIKEMGAIVGVLGIGCGIFYFLLSGLGVKVAGIRGIGLAYVLTWITVLAFSLWNIFRNDFKVFFCRKTLNFFVKQIVLLALVYLFVSLAFTSIERFNFQGLPYSIVLFTTCGFAGGAFYLFLSKIFKVQEINSLSQNLLQVFSKK